MPSIDPSLRIRSVALAVADLQRSADFYQRVLGLTLTATAPGTVQLGPDPGRPNLILKEINSPTPLPVASTGLYHVAWLHHSRAALAQTVRRVGGAGWPFEGASDHGVSEALYLSDPDGLGLEIYADRPRDQWEAAEHGRRVNMGTLPLDLNDLLAQSTASPPPRIAADTVIGHIHLKVADVPRSAAFYRDALGFDERAVLPSAAFLSAGGYHHHVGLNSWQSAGASRPPDSAPGLERVEFELSSEQALGELERRVGERPLTREDPASLSLEDPDGQLIAFSVG